MKLEKTSHCVYKIRYHMVTAVKYRKALLNKDVEECIKEIMKGISERYEITIDEMGFDQNHIHIFCGAEPNTSPMRILSIIKSITARKIFEKFPKLKKEELWGGEFWSDGKYIGTIGEATNEEIIKKYIRNQSIDKSEIERRTGQLRLFKFIFPACRRHGIFAFFIFSASNMKCMDHMNERVSGSHAPSFPF